MFREKADSLLVTITVAVFILLAIYLLTQDASSVGPL
jgi:hypothetical protein